MKRPKLTGFLFGLVAAIGLALAQPAGAKGGGTMVMLVQPEPPSLASYL